MITYDREKDQKSKASFNKHKKFLRDVENRAKKSILKSLTLIKMWKMSATEMIIKRLLGLTGKYLIKKKPIETVLYFDEGPEDVRIEDVLVPYISLYDSFPDFDNPLFKYRVKLKNGKWSKSTYEVEAEWALSQIERYIVNS
jgi:hypothetical protein